MLLTDPHTGSSSSSAPQSQLPRAALAKVTLHKTSVTRGCCLWQPVPMMGMFFIAAKQGKRCGMCLCKPRAWHGPWESSSLAQSSIPVLTILSHQPVSKSQSFQKSVVVCFFKKRNSFCFPASSHPVPLPPPPWNGSVPPGQRPASVGVMPQAHPQGKPGPSVLYSQETLKSACQFAC